MKKVMGLVCGIGCLFVIAGHSWAAAGKSAETLELSGVIVDNKCAGEHQGDIMFFLKNHNKECALKTESQAGGYSLITPDGVVTPIDAKSNAMIVKFLRRADTKLSAAVKARLVGDKLEIISLQPLKHSPKKPKPAK